MPMRIRGRSAPTTLQHRIALRHFDRFLNRKATIGDLNNETVTAFGTWLADGTREAITVNKTVEKVLAQWRFYNRRGIVSTWPDVMALPEVERVPEAWLPDELARLFAACKAQEGDIVGVPAGLWWLGLHYAIYDTAERIGAVRAIEWRNVDLAGGWVRFPGGTRKGGKRDIVRRLHPDTVAHLRTMIEPKRECVFPWPWDTSLLYFMYERVLRAAGLPWDRRCKFHKLRRTVASMYHQAGGDPTAFLDHSSRKVTQAYLDPRIVQTPQAADLLPRVSIR
ncbi:MAG: site-specific integrase [Planctomycetia bacterium]|nr:site-specific integrase [Planctomycetia bacterium]